MKTKAKTEVLSIAPSELTFLMTNCAECYRAKVLDGWRAPYRPFPSVFTKIDGAMRRALHGMRSEVFGLPPGVIDTSNTAVKSRPFSLPSGDLPLVRISGRRDLLVNFDDGTVGIYDCKTSELKEDTLNFYKAQLYPMMIAMEQPEKGDPVKVSKLGLFSISPNAFDAATMSLGCDHKIESFTPVLAEIDELLGRITAVLHGQIAGAHNCPDCALRRSGWVQEKKGVKSE